jgi:hypothetical protein
VKARTTPFDNPVRSVQDAAGRTPPWVWRTAATLIGMAAAGLITRAFSMGQARVRANSAIAAGKERVGWPAALLGAGVAGIVASIGRLAAQQAVTRAWTRRASLQPE